MMILLKKVSLICCVIFATVCNGQNHYEKGYKEYLNENYSKSIEFFGLAIENNQEIAKSYMYRGIAKGYMNDFYHAIEDLNESKKIDSTDYKLYYFYGKSYMLGGFVNSGLEYINKAIVMNDKDAELFDSRGVIKASLGKYDEAITDMDLAIKIDSQNANFFVNRGFIYSILKNYKIAIENYNSALKIKKSHRVYANRGAAYFELKMYAKSIEDYNNALVFNHEDYITYYLRGNTYKQMGELKKACLDFERSAKLGYKEAINAVKINCNN